MVVEIELERTFLAKNIPENLEKCEFVELEDNFIPKNSKHPILRIRRKGSQKVITRKYQKEKSDSSVMIEETIVLSSEEFDVLNKLEGKRFLKRRYFYEYRQGEICEFDVYQDKLKGLVVVDFEFKTVEEKNNFIKPEFCLVEVTNEEFVAGGMLSGKTYDDIEQFLEKFNYKKLI